MSDSLQALRKTIAALRDPENGCPWDLKQTHESLKKYLLEEAYEAVEAVSTSPDHLCEELGDVLLQIYLHSQIAEENGDFTIEKVAQKLNDKLIRRHPHVFGDQKADTAEEVAVLWESVKSQESPDTSETTPSLLANTPKALPASMQSVEIGKTVATINFDWPTAEEIIEKVREELKELEDELTGNNTDRLKEELGDLLFTVSQLARKLKLDPETTLLTANQKFTTRFQKLERQARLQHPDLALNQLSRSQLEALWRAIK